MFFVRAFLAAGFLATFEDLGVLAFFGTPLC
jgi:hypothetical protein